MKHPCTTPQVDTPDNTPHYLKGSSVGSSWLQKGDENFFKHGQALKELFRQKY